MKKITSFEKSRFVGQRALDLIPGGSHTYSKGIDQYPYNSPWIIDRGEGAYIYDLDGNKYIDYALGLRSIVLGHSYPKVNDAVIKQLIKGSNFPRPSTIEVEAAEKILKFLKKFDMVKFAKNGSTVTTAAVKLARAFTKKKLILCPAEHPFYSYDDWFIGSTLSNNGIPNEITNLTIRFKWNDFEHISDIFQKYGEDIACVITEGLSVEKPENNFLKHIENLCAHHGALFVLDEMVNGLRLAKGGALEFYDLNPDLATFGKAIGNGHSVAALVGKKEIMQLGGLNNNLERVFLISTTHGSEAHGLAALIAVLDEFTEKDVVGHLWKLGQILLNSFNESLKKYNLSENMMFKGFPSNLWLVTKDAEQKPDMVSRTLFVQECIARGIMPQAGSFATSFSHTENDVELTCAIFDEVCAYISPYVHSNQMQKILVGDAIKPVFRKIN